MVNQCIGNIVRSGYYLKSKTIILEGWLLPVPDKIEIWTSDTLIGLARLGVPSQSVFAKHPEYNEKNSGWIFGYKTNCKINYIEARAIYGKECIKCEKANIIDVQGSFRDNIVKSVFDRGANYLDVRGWCLPKADRVEIWNENSLLGDAVIGLESLSVYNLFPEFEEKYSAWRYYFKASSFPAQITVKSFYNEHCISSKTVNVEETFDIKSKVSYCTQEKEYICAEGWFLPVPDSVEIWENNTKLGQAKNGISSSSLQKNYPEYLNANGIWFFLKKKSEVVKKVEIRALYSGICKKKKTIEVSQKPIYIKGKTTYCTYDLATGYLSVQGWYLPKADKVEIWIDKQILDATVINQNNAHIYELFPEIEGMDCSWSCVSKIEYPISELTVKIYYDNYCVREESVKVNEIFSIKSKVNYCVQNGKYILAEGYFLPRPEKVEIWENNNYLGCARIGIPALSLYKSYPEYEEENAVWAFGSMINEKTVLSDLLIKAIYNEQRQEEIYVPLEKITKPLKGAVKYCHYNVITEILQIGGWYLPKADKIEVWENTNLLGNANLNLKSENIYNEFIEFNELYAAWDFNQRICDFQKELVTIKVFYNGEVVLEENRKVKFDNPKVVSFDIFDTLLVRPVLMPTEMFKLVALRAGYDKSFQQMRITAEKIAREKYKCQKEDITLDEIYQEIVSLYQIKAAEAERIKQIELSVEMDYLRPRMSIFKIFTKAQKLNKKIIAISDMYLSSVFLNTVLEKNGYKNISKIYVSSEQKVAKGTGNLFKKVLSEYEEQGIKANEILHIGDNLHVDATVPLKLGMQATHFPKTSDILKNTVYYKEYIQNLKPEMDNNFWGGLIANELFDDYYTEFDRNTLFNGEFKIMGKLLFAPLLLHFVLWMLRDMEKENINQILLTYRDGYMIERIINILHENIQISCLYEHLYLSRTIRYNGYVRKNNGFWRALVEYPVNNMTVDNFIKKRLLVVNKIERNDCLKIIKEYLGLDAEDLIGGIDNIALILPYIEPFFKKHALENLKIIDAYCEQKIGKSRKAVFDIGYRGKTVDFLIDNYSATCKGYQLFAYSLMDKHEKGCDNTETYISYGFSNVKQLKIAHHLFEDILCIQEGTAKAIQKENGEFKIIREDTAINSNLATIQESILESIIDFVQMFRKDLLNLEFERYPEHDLLKYFLLHPNIKDAKCIRKLSFSDSEFIGKPGENAYKDWYIEFFGLETIKENDM